MRQRLKASLEEDPEFKKAHKTKDVLKLRNILRVVTFHYRKSEEPIKTLWKANKDFLNLCQHRMDITDYYKKFTDMKNLEDEMAGEEEGTYNHSGIINILCSEKGIDQSSIDSAKETELMMEGQERMLAMHFLMNADQDRYGEVIRIYNQGFLSRNNKYPTTLHGAYTLLKHWSYKCELCENII